MIFQVSVQAKILSKEQPTTKSVKMASVLLSNCIMADQTGSIKLALWGEDIPKISVGQSYDFENLIVKEFDGKYLSLSKKTIYRQIDDIGPVVETEEIDIRSKIQGSVQMVSVSLVTLCASCFRTTTEPLEGKLLIKCPGCNMKQKSASLKKSITINIKLDNDDTKYIVQESQIHSFLSNKNKEQLAETPEELEDFILNLDTISYFSSGNRVSEFIVE